MRSYEWIPIVHFEPESVVSQSSSETNPSIDTSKYENLSLDEMEAILNKEYSNGEMDAEELQDVEGNLENYHAVQQTLTDLKVTYSPVEGYKYTFPDANSLIMSVPDGAVTSQSVRVQNSGYLVVKVTKDGEALLGSSGTYYTDPGNYTVDFQSLTVNQNAMTVNNYQSTVSFTIEDSEYTKNTQRVAPRGFTITGVTIDGETQLVGTRQRDYNAEKDGSYQIEYVADKDSSVTYTESFILDRVAPEITFSQPIEKKVFPPVQMTCNDPEATVKIIKGGLELESTDELATGGVYTVIAVDKAGNETSYKVVVNHGGRGISILWPLFFVGLFLAIGLRIRYLKKNQRIS